MMGFSRDKSLEQGPGDRVPGVPLLQGLGGSAPNVTPPAKCRDNVPAFSPPRSYFALRL